MVHLLLSVIYLSFISLGLPDSLLGAAWPSMYGELQVPVSYAGILSMIIALGTVISSLCSDRLTRRLGAGKVTLISVAMTATALLGFSFSHSFLLLCLLAVPYGLGAGSIDAALNNYVALHYSAKHMSWLHCMWGVGTIIGPSVMSYALTGGLPWQAGYRYVAIFQFVLTAILVFSLPLWKQNVKGECSADDPVKDKKPLSLSATLRIPGAKEVMITFFCYCAAEQTAMLWASSYMHLYNGVGEELAAGFAGMFVIGITVGRLISGFLAGKLSDTQLIRLGQCLMLAGVVVVLLPFGQVSTVIGMILFGLGGAPIYPCLIHSTPILFGAERSQAMIGLQMASAYVGTCLMPPLFGLIANHIHVAWLPIYLLFFTVLMIFTHRRLVKKAGGDVVFFF